jgi:high affinity Mn2+ porin
LILRKTACVLGLLVGLSSVAGAQDGSAEGGVSAESDHHIRFDWGYQATVITQTAPVFASPYMGPRSFADEGSSRASTTLTTTLYTGLVLWQGAWVSVQPEFAAGLGVGGGQGIAAYVNQDAVKSGNSIKQTPYLARVFIHQDISLGSGPGEAEFEGGDGNRDLDAFVADSNSHFESGAKQRLEITLGKFSLPDFFDSNEVAGDVHHRLMNWALVNNGSWDYSADARGYTWGIVLGLFEGPISARLALTAMPSEANGIQFDKALSEAHAENAEFSWEFNASKKGVLRLLAWQNHARMGSYEEALRSASESGDAAPDITASRHPGRTKRGVGVNIGGDLGEWSAFLRTGWSDGKNESFAYTEIDRTVSLGVAHAANFLGRPKDTLVMGFVASGLSSLHRRYLAAGGIGFQIGDGRLNYACEQVLEGNYNAQVTRNVSLAIDVQRVWNPGYNHDRGPISVYGVRIHLHP